MDAGAWTIDQLAERVGAALSSGYDGQPSGRVREVPDRRAIRYYTTLGLVDRPAAMRGRTAVYGRRHLLQLVAIKRLQAAGRSLAEVQAELAGASDTQLDRVARIPESLPGPPPERAPSRQAPAARRATMGLAGAPTLRRGTTGPAGAPTLRASGAAPATPVRPDRAGFWRREPGPAAAGEAGAIVQGVRLGRDATLLVEGWPSLDELDLHAILTAAGPLLDELAARRRDPGRDHR